MGGGLVSQNPLAQFDDPPKLTLTGTFQEIHSAIGIPQSVLSKSHAAAQILGTKAKELILPLIGLLRYLKESDRFSFC